MSTAVGRSPSPALWTLVRWGVGFAAAFGVLAASPLMRPPPALLLAFGLLGGLSLSGAV